MTRKAIAESTRICSYCQKPTATGIEMKKVLQLKFRKAYYYTVIACPACASSYLSNLGKDK